MAAAVVSGAAALLAEGKPRLTPLAVRVTLRYSAERAAGEGLLQRGQADCTLWPHLSHRRQEPVLVIGGEEWVPGRMAYAGVVWRSPHHLGQRRGHHLGRPTSSGATPTSSGHRSGDQASSGATHIIWGDPRHHLGRRRGIIWGKSSGATNHLGQRRHHLGQPEHHLGQRRRHHLGRLTFHTKETT